MKVWLLNYSDSIGGASRAAYRLHRALLDYGAESRMQVRIKRTDDWTVCGPRNELSKLGNALRSAFGQLTLRLQKSGEKSFHSGNWIPSFWARKLNTADCEVVNLHWVGAETLSVEDIGRIRKPIVWTLHDMWPFCGTEHYTNDDTNARWRHGYVKFNQFSFENGFDLDLMVWQRKMRSWQRPMHIISPSNWLANCARNSVIFKSCAITVIPNVLDTQAFKPMSRDVCRHALGLPLDKKIILFGAMGGGRDPRKGFDLLLETLESLAQGGDLENVLCVVFGQGEPMSPQNQYWPIRWMGELHDDAILALLYNSADLMVVPSRQENLPQTATEAQACGCPVVAFDCTGFRDVVVHKETGFLARAFDTAEMAEGIRWIFANTDRRNKLGDAARERALRLWAPDVVIPQYMSVYRSILGRD